jgi:hypothetical protein
MIHDELSIAIHDQSSIMIYDELSIMILDLSIDRNPQYYNLKISEGHSGYTVET